MSLEVKSFVVLLHRYFLDARSLVGCRTPGFLFSVYDFPGRVKWWSIDVEN